MIGTPATTAMFLSACILLIVILALRRGKIGLAHPIVIHTGGWIFPFLLAPALVLTGPYANWSMSEELAIGALGAYAMFTAGSLVGRLLSPLHGARAVVPVGGRPRFFARFRRQAHLLAVLGLAGATWNLSNVVAAGGFSVYLELGMREVELIFGASTLVNYVYFLNILALVMLVALREYGHGRRLDLFLAGVLLLALMTHGLKSTVIWPLIMCGVVVLSCQRMITLGKLALSALIVAVIFLLVSIGRELPLIIMGMTSIDDMMVRSVLNIPLYFSSGFTNLQLELENFSDFQFGAQQLGPLYELANFLLGQNRQASYQGAEPMLFYPGYNTSTYLLEPFRDLGWLGIMVTPFFAGLVARLIYATHVRSCSPYSLLIYAIVGAMLFATFFSNHFLRIQYLYLITIVGVLAVLNPWRPAEVRPVMNTMRRATQAR